MFENGLIKMVASFIVNALNSVNDMFVDLFILKNPANNSQIQEILGISTSIGTYLIRITFVYFLLIYLINFDYEKTSYLRKKVGQTLLLGLVFPNLKIVSDIIFDFFNMIVSAWGGTGSILGVFGLQGGAVATVASIIGSFNFFTIWILGAITILIVVIVIVNSLISNLLYILTAMLPILIGLYLFDAARPILKKAVTLYIGLMAAMPMQLLSIVTMSQSVENIFTNPSLTSLVNALTMLILVTVIIPVTALFIFVTGASITNIDK